MIVARDAPPMHRASLRHLPDGPDSRREFSPLCIKYTVPGLATVVISLFMTWFLRIHGSVLEMSESLLYCGFMDLDLTSLFSGVVCLSAGGAVMDLSIDVAAAMWEVKEHAPDASGKELFRSGMEVGRAGVGTQITTLLLAYMGSYLTLMMVYMAQATPIPNILTSKSIAAEILQTLAGSFGIVLVTPLTAAAGLFLFAGKKVRE